MITLNIQLVNKIIILFAATNKCQFFVSSYQRALQKSQEGKIRCKSIQLQYLLNLWLLEMKNNNIRKKLKIAQELEKKALVLKNFANHRKNLELDLEVKGNCPEYDVICKALATARFNFGEYIKQEFWIYIEICVDVFDPDKEYKIYQFLPISPKLHLEYVEGNKYKLSSSSVKSLLEWIKSTEGVKAFFHDVVFGDNQQKVLENFRVHLDHKYLQPKAEPFIKAVDSFKSLDKELIPYLIEKFHSATIVFKDLWLWFLWNI